MTRRSITPLVHRHASRLLLLVCLSVGLAACGGSGSGGEAAEETEEATTIEETQPETTTEAAQPPSGSGGDRIEQLTPEQRARFTGSGTLTVDGKTFRFFSACADEEERDSRNELQLAGIGEDGGRSFTVIATRGRSPVGGDFDQVYLMYSDEEQAQRLAYDSLDDGITIEGGRVTYEGEFSAGVTDEDDGEPVGQGSFEATCS